MKLPFNVIPPTTPLALWPFEGLTAPVSYPLYVRIMKAMIDAAEPNDLATAISYACYVQYTQMFAIELAEYQKAQGAGAVPVAAPAAPAASPAAASSVAADGTLGSEVSGAPAGALSPMPTAQAAPPAPPGEINTAFGPVAAAPSS
jgi:hypothetical protein